MSYASDIKEQIHMSQPEGEGTQSGAEGTQSSAGDTTGTVSTTEVTTGEGTQSGATDADRFKADAESYREKMRAADQRAGKFEAELKQLRDKDLPAAEKLQRDFQEAQEQVASLQTANKDLALQVAFLKDNTFKWHNPERALKLADLTQVEIGADGTVNGLKDALKALSVSDPYLIAQEAESPKQEPGGTAPGNNGTSGTKPTSNKAMAARIPALNTRVKRS